MKLIIVGNRAINLEQVVSAEHNPGFDAYDATLILTLTSFSMESSGALDQNPTSDKRILHGTDAERVWNHFRLAGLILTDAAPALTPAESAAMDEDLKSAG